MSHEITDTAVPYLRTLIEVAEWAKAGFPEDPSVEAAIEWADSVLDDLGATTVAAAHAASRQRAHDDDVDRRIDLRREDRR